MAKSDGGNKGIRRASVLSVPVIGVVLLLMFGFGGLGPGGSGGGFLPGKGTAEQSAEQSADSEEQKAEDQESEKKEEPAQTEENGSVDADAENKDEAAEAQSKVLVVTIKQKQILTGDRVIAEPADVVKEAEGMEEVLLKDDYADNEVWQQVIRALEDAGITYGTEVL